MQIAALHRMSGHPHRDAMRAYVMHWIRNPDPDSVFDKKTRIRHFLNDFILLFLFPLMGYGGWLFLIEGLVVGHVFYQAEKDALKIFAVGHNQKRGTGATLIRMVLSELEHMHHIRRVRIGAGGDPAIKRLWEKVLEGNITLPFKVSHGEGVGWINIERTAT